MRYLLFVLALLAGANISAGFTTHNGITLVIGFLDFFLCIMLLCDSEKY